MRSPRAARRWVYLPVETKAREWESKILLAAAAARAGYGVVVGQHRRLDAIVDRLPPGLFLDKSYHRGHLRWVKRRLAAGHTNVGLDEEGLVAPTIESFGSSRLSSEVVEASAAVCTWGDQSVDTIAFREYLPAQVGKVRRTGHPRADLWRTELRGLYRDDARARQAQYGRYVLFPSSFSMVIHRDGPELITRFLQESGMFDDAEGRELFAALLDYKQRILREVRAALPRFARALPEHTLVIRPHPGDNADYWREVAAEAPNMRVVLEGPVTPWILGADAVVHNNCTTGLETFVLDRPVVAYMPTIDPALEYPVLNEVSQQAYDVDGLIDLVRANIDSPLPANQDLKAKVTSVICSAEGRPATDRLMDVFDSLGLDEYELPSLRSLPLRRRARRSRAVTAGVAKRAAHLIHANGTERDPGVTRAYQRQKFPGADRREVETLVRRLDEVTGNYGGVEVRALDQWIFSVTADQPLV